MAIFDEGVYSISEASEHTNISVRTMQRLCKTHNLEKQDGGYLITGVQLKEWMQERLKPTPNDTQRHDTTTDGGALADEETHQQKLRKAIELITLEAAKKNITHKVFTEDEYVDLIGTLDRVEHQQEQIQYLRKRIERQDETLTKLFQNIQERNYIEANEKKKEDQR